MSPDQSTCSICGSDHAVDIRCLDAALGDAGRLRSENEILRGAEKRQCNRADEAEHDRDELRAENERLRSSISWARGMCSDMEEYWRIDEFLGHVLDGMETPGASDEEGAP